jgi:aryl-alcohol dehydrogenase-like predicted oxidoreductase
MKTQIQFGLGLIGIGRAWGYRQDPIPSEALVNQLLSHALRLGIRFLDTAPAYGNSEERLGEFLNTLNSEEVAQLIVATKCGEHWDAQSGLTYVDHSYAALCHSLDNSLRKLRKVDVLQLHKSTPPVLRDITVHKAFEYAISRGVRTFGASVSDLESATIAIQHEMYSYIQFPFNLANRALEQAFDLADKHGKKIIVNRPFDEGRLLYTEAGKGNSPEALAEAYRFILQRSFRGVILSGTKLLAHLGSNWSAFQSAMADL